MIKFFRKIRYNLVNDNKTGKYFKYAIGEIVLVVVGILIALSLNNWNESRKALNSELKLYSKLIDDLNNRFGSTYFQINRFKSYQNMHLELYNEINGNINFTPTNNYNQLQWVISYHLDITEKYSEVLNKLSNDYVRDLLQNYIRQEKVTKDAFDEWNELKEQRLRPFFREHGIHNTEEVYNDENIYDFFSMSTNTLLEKDKLMEQFGTTELDELLFDLRFKTSWVYSNLNSLNNANNLLEQELVNNLAKTKYRELINRIPRKTIEDLISDNKTIDEIVELVKSQDENAPVYLVSENTINSFGYSLMKQNKTEDALKIFKLNTELYPNESNTYDSYGECLLRLGDRENAIKAYKKSLELDPDNSNAREVLSELK